MYMYVYICIYKAVQSYFRPQDVNPYSKVRLPIQEWLKTPGVIADDSFFVQFMSTVRSLPTNVVLGVNLQGPGNHQGQGGDLEGGEDDQGEGEDDQGGEEDQQGQGGDLEGGEDD